MLGRNASDIWMIERIVRLRYPRSIVIMAITLPVRGSHPVKEPTGVARMPRLAYPGRRRQL
jgi:hypothetical protein